MDDLIIYFGLLDFVTISMLALSAAVIFGGLLDWWWNGRTLVSRLADVLANNRPFVRVHPVRQMQVMRLGGAERDHGNFVAILLGVLVRRFSQNPRAHRI